MSSEESEGGEDELKKKKHRKVAAEEWTDPWARGMPEKSKMKKKKKKEKVSLDTVHFRHVQLTKLYMYT